MKLLAWGKYVLCFCSSSVLCTFGRHRPRPVASQREASSPERSCAWSRTKAAAKAGNPAASAAAIVVLVVVVAGLLVLIGPRTSQTRLRRRRRLGPHQADRAAAATGLCSSNRIYRQSVFLRGRLPSQLVRPLQFPKSEIVARFFVGFRNRGIVFTALGVPAIHVRSMLSRDP